MSSNRCKIEFYIYCIESSLKNYDQKKKERIINISSINLVGARITVSNYSVANGGVNMLTKPLAAALGEYNINVNVIAPRYFITVITQILASKALVYTTGKSR